MISLMPLLMWLMIWPLAKQLTGLICGDVGFGKTEVALRAAFVVAMAGYQVALVTPTTLLARQHGQVFKDRFVRLSD